MMSKSGLHLPLGFKGRYLLQSMGMDLDDSLPLIGSFFEPKDRLDLIKDKTIFENVSLKNKALETLDIIQRATEENF